MFWAFFLQTDPNIQMDAVGSMPAAVFLLIIVSDIIHSIKSITRSQSNE